MKQEEKQLTYYQIMIFMHKIEEIKNNNPTFNDEIILNFENYAIQRTCEISNLSPIKLKIKPSLGMYLISNDMFNYLSKITGINPLDKEIYNYYIPFVKQKEKEILENSNDIFKKR